ncbi:MAG: DDE-type integrase/transposase/recombinase, partial [Leptospirales bacterium]
KEVVPYRAATAQHLTSNESDNGVAFIVSPSPSQLVLSPSRPLHNVPANYTTHEVWIFDTGASFHITADFSHLQEPVRCHVGLTVGGGRVMHATHQGNVSLDVEVSGSVISVTLSDVLYVPDWNEACLISWRKIDELGNFRMIGESGVIDIIRKVDNAIVFSATLQHGSYQVNPIVRHGKIYIAATDFWHQALGHTSTRFWSDAKSLYQDGSILPKRPSHYWCPTCAKYNSKQVVPTSVKNPKATKPYDLVHSDLMGPFKVESLGRRKYMLTLVENATRYSEVNFLNKKSDTTRFIKAFCEKVKTQTKHYPRAFRTDQGGEFDNKDLALYFEERGIKHQPSAAYSHESNGTAERYNLTLTNMVRPALEDVPPSLWAEAFNWACYLKNRLPHSALNGKTPFEALYNTKPTISHLRPFYSKCFVHIPEEKRTAGSKLNPRALEGRLVGYTDSGHMFRIYIPSQHKVDTYRQVKFEPSSSYTSVDVHYPPLPSDIADDPTSTAQPLRPDSPTTPQKSTAPAISPPSPPENTEEYQSFSEDDYETERDTPTPTPSAGPSTPPRRTSANTPAAPKTIRTKKPAELTDTPRLDYENYPQPRMSQRQSKAPDRYSQSGWARLVAEPNSYREAMASPDSDSWQQAMLEEHQAIEEAGT